MTTTSTGNRTALPIAHDWGSRTHVQIFVLMSATSFGLYLCCLLAAPFLASITWSLALAVIFLPLQRWMETKFRNRNVAAAISVFVIGVVVLALVTFVGQRLVLEASSGARSVDARIESGEWRKVLEIHPRLAPLADWMEQQNLPETLKAGVTWLSTTGASFVRGSVVGVMSLLLTFYLLFYFLRDRRAGIAKLRTALPLSVPEMDRLFSRVDDTIHATIYGTLTVAAVQGVLGGLMFWWLGFSSPLLWGVVMGLLAVVPILGAFIVWLPAALFLLIDGHWGQALILTSWGMFVVGTIDNLLRPVLVGDRLQMHTVMAFISVVGGIIVFGPAGLILGPVALTITTVLLEIWPKHELRSVAISVDSDAISSFENEGGAVASANSN
jgi:predicted PurR-regulated permease PerM